VSNIGGAIDAPLAIRRLFLGYLKGVPVLLLMKVPMWCVVVLCCRALFVFFFISTPPTVRKLKLKAPASY